MDCERVDTFRELARQRRIDHAVALDPALPFEGLRHNINPEMRLSARPVAGMTFVLVRLIEHAQAFGRESLGQLLRDEIMSSHRSGLAIAGTYGQLSGSSDARHFCLSSLRASPWRPHNGRS